MPTNEGWTKLTEPYAYDSKRLRKDQQMLKNHLRQFFAFSRVRRHILRLAAHKKGRLVRYQCASCKNLFREQSVEIDHIKEVAPKKQHTNLQTYSNDLTKQFFNLSNLRVLCRQCHAQKDQYDL